MKKNLVAFIGVRSRIAIEKKNLNGSFYRDCTTLKRSTAGMLFDRTGLEMLSTSIVRVRPVIPQVDVRSHDRSCVLVVLEAKPPQAS